MIGLSSTNSTKARRHWLGATAIGLGAIPMIAFNWIAMPLSRHLSAFEYPLLGRIPADPAPTLCSFGVIAVALVALLACSCLFEKPILQSLASAGLLIVLLWSYLHFALADARFLLEAFRESEWWLLMVGTPPPRAVVEPSMVRQVSHDVLSNRLLSAWSYIGLGWYTGVAFAALCFAGAAKLLRPCITWRIASVGFASVILLSTVFFYRPVLAEFTIARAVTQQVQGDANSAAALYDKAVELDDWYFWNTKIYSRIGALYAALGQTSAPEYRVYRAETIFDSNQGPAFIGDLLQSIELYESIAAQGGKLAGLAAMRSRDIRILYGSHLFQMGAFGAAVREWETVLHSDRNNWLAAYYLAVAYPSLGRSRDLARVTQLYLDKCADPLVLGILYNRLGYAHTRVGNFGPAHQAFFDSYRIDYLRNRYGIAGLVGP